MRVALITRVVDANLVGGADESAESAAKLHLLGLDADSGTVALHAAALDVGVVDAEQARAVAGGGLLDPEAAAVGVALGSKSSRGKGSTSSGGGCGSEGRVADASAGAVLLSVARRVEFLACMAARAGRDLEAAGAVTCLQAGPVGGAVAVGIGDGVGRRQGCRQERDEREERAEEHCWR